MRSILALWIRLHRMGAAIGERHAAAARRRRAARELAELDERTLRDIGLESWRSSLGARIEAHRRATRLWSAARIGLY